jgi:hypothetical protein
VREVRDDRRIGVGVDRRGSTPDDVIAFVERGRKDGADARCPVVQACELQPQDAGIPLMDVICIVKAPQRSGVSA